ncbi:MAG: hypothetical protein ABIP65_10340, partial [Vicinamibacterales bacterium]
MGQFEVSDLRRIAISPWTVDQRFTRSTYHPTHKKGIEKRTNHMANAAPNGSHSPVDNQGHNEFTKAANSQKAPTVSITS